MKELNLFYNALKRYERKYNNLDYENLQIIFYPKSPVVFSSLPLHFDGLISGILFEKILNENNFYYNILYNETVNIPIPINKILLSNNDIMYKASMLKSLFELKLKKTTMKKRFCDKYLYYMQDIRKIAIDSGIFKNTNLPIVYDATLSPLICYCEGNKKEIMELLKMPLSIGKHREKGFGFIKDIEIININKDYSIWGRNGNLNRCIPEFYFIEQLKQGLDNINIEFIRGEFNYKPPYFELRTNNNICLIPRL